MAIDGGVYPSSVIRSGPDYGIGNVGKCLGPTTSKGPTKDGCRIFQTHVITNHWCFMQCKHRTVSQNNTLTV